ncbi:hypothetical protein K501DRAFT_220167 [Backusella circina FSU 941]|nr:hypothetical protein K501DRAFT_220167 [Backusella circina FSU 941]
MFLFSPGFEAATLKIPSKGMEPDLLVENRKQIIGFVKFRTRLEALTAKQVLSGKKIDADCVLKAEMAKKNLHINNKKQQQQQQNKTYEAFHSVSADIATNEIYSDHPLFDPFFIGLERSLSLENSSRVHQLHPPPPPKKKRPTEPQANHPSLGNPTSSFMSAVYPSKSHPITFPTPPNSASSSDFLYSPSNRLSFFQEDDGPQFSTISPTSSYRNLGSTNPADQNPPCNTLYVGNLPSKTNERELLALFSKCTGYRRLSFRTKSNGPMCFVEFNNISCATRALQDLHGIPLSNSAKDGIRLSFSKNPLGVRTSSSSSIQHSIQH